MNWFFNSMMLFSAFFSVTGGAFLTDKTTGHPEMGFMIFAAMLIFIGYLVLIMDAKYAP